MLQKAIEKLKNEMDQNKNNPCIQAIGNFLVQCVKENPDAAGKILNKDKTISKSIEEMRKEASKKRVGNCAMLSDQEGFNIALKYFDIGAESKISETKLLVPEVKPKKTNFDVTLDELLK